MNAFCGLPYIVSSVIIGSGLIYVTSKCHDCCHDDALDGRHNKFNAGLLKDCIVLRGTKVDSPQGSGNGAHTSDKSITERDSNVILKQEL